MRENQHCAREGRGRCACEGARGGSFRPFAGARRREAVIDFTHAWYFLGVVFCKSKRRAFQLKNVGAALHFEVTLGGEQRVWGWREGGMEGGRRCDEGGVSRRLRCREGRVGRGARGARTFMPQSLPQLFLPNQYLIPPGVVPHP